VRQKFCRKIYDENTEKSSVCLVFFSPNRSVTYISPDNFNPIQRPTQTPTHHHYSLGHLAKTTQKKQRLPNCPTVSPGHYSGNCTDNYKSPIWVIQQAFWHNSFDITVRPDTFTLTEHSPRRQHVQSGNKYKHHHIEQFGSASPISYVLSSYYTRTEEIKRNAAILEVSPPLLLRLICADRPS
jgi:hypothetical protein